MIQITILSKLIKEQAMKNTDTKKKYEISTSIIIHASLYDVWRVLSDFGNVYQWAPPVTKSYTIGNPKLGVGHGRHCDIEGFGSLDEYLIEWKENEGFTYTVTPLGPLDASISTWKTESLGLDKCKIEITLAYDIRYGIFGKLMHSLIMRGKLCSGLPQTLQALKKHIESNQNITTAQLAI